jgi:hypothetical protein
LTLTVDPDLRQHYLAFIPAHVAGLQLRSLYVMSHRVFLRST